MSDLIELLAEWRNRLGLQDWHIELNEGCRPEDMDMQNAEGCTTWVESTKTAVIDLLAPEFYPTNAVSRGVDYERTLVHELLHCKLSLIQDTENQTQNRFVHMLIDDLARAMVDAKRSGEAEIASLKMEVEHGQKSKD